MNPGVIRTVTAFAVTVLLLCGGLACVADRTPPETQAGGNGVVAAAVRAIEQHNPGTPPVRREIRELHAEHPDYVERALAAAEDPQRGYRQRLRLLWTLGYLGPDAAPAVPRLVAYAFGGRPFPLSAEDEATTQRLATILRNVERPFNDHRGIAREVLRSIGRPAVPALLQVLATGSAEDARSAVGVLRGMGREARRAVPLLLERLNSADDEEEMLWIADALRKIDRGSLRSREARGARPRLLAATRHESLNVQARAVRLLPLFGVPAERAVPAVVRVLSKAMREEPQVGLGAILFFEVGGEYGREAAPILAEALASDDAAVRQAAAALFAAQGVARGRDVRLLARVLRADPGGRRGPRDSRVRPVPPRPLNVGPFGRSTSGERNVSSARCDCCRSGWGFSCDGTA